MGQQFKIVEGPYLADILAQPQALEAALGGLGENQAVTAIASSLASGALTQIVLTGMGSSLHALTPLHLALCRRGLRSLTIETSELVHQAPGLLGQGSLIVAVSQSGRSAETLRLLEAKPPETPLIGVTNHPESPLARHADATLRLNAGPESTVTCKTYVATLAVLEWLGAVFSDQNPEGVRRGFDGVPAAMSGYFSAWRDHVRELAALLEGVEVVFVTGRGRSLAAAATAGLIVKEAAHFPAEGMSSAAFRHGPFEMVYPGALVLVFVGDRSSEPLNRRLVEDVRQAGGRAFLVGAATGPGVFRLPSVPAPASPVMEILPIQMLTLALAARCGREAGRFERATKITATE